MNQAPGLQHGTTGMGASVNAVAETRAQRRFRHINPDEQMRLEAAASAEDERRFGADMAKAIASPNTDKLSPEIPASLRRCLVDAFESNARSILGRTPHTVPPRLQAFLMLTLRVGLGVQQSISVRWSDINQHSGLVSVRQQSGYRRTFQLSPENVILLTTLRRSDPGLPLLELSHTLLQTSWTNICVAASLRELTLADLEFEVQFRRIMRPDER